MRRERNRGFLRRRGFDPKLSSPTQRGTRELCKNTCRSVCPPRYCAAEEGSASLAGAKLMPQTADRRAPNSMVAYAMPLHCYPATASGPGQKACPSKVARVFRGEVPDAAVPSSVPQVGYVAA